VEETIMDKKNILPTETDGPQRRSYLAAKEIIPDAISTIEQLYHRKESCTGISTGFAELDYITSGFQNSEFIVIGAQPSVGKTALALTIASNIAIKNKIPVGFFTLEMTGRALLNRLIETESECEISRHEHLAEISRSIKLLAKEMNIPIVFIPKFTKFENLGRDTS
jgi:replicative DNA helicase